MVMPVFATNLEHDEVGQNLTSGQRRPRRSDWDGGRNLALPPPPTPHKLPGRKAGHVGRSEGTGRRHQKLQDVPGMVIYTYFAISRIYREA